MSETTTINNQVSSQNSQVPQRVYNYDPFNNRTLVQEYDFGTGGPGALLQTTNNVFEQIGSILDLPKSVQVVDNAHGGAQDSFTQYYYDQNAITTYTGAIINHDATVGNKGNVTSVLNNPPVQNPSVYYYDNVGNVVTSVDPPGVQRNYGYSDSPSSNGIPPTVNNFPPPGSTTYALPTSVTSYAGLTSVPGGTTRPSGSGTAFTADLTYDYNIGKPTQTVDINSNATNYAYNDPGNLDRLTNVTRPDTGTTTFLYDDTPLQVSVGSLVDQNSANDHNMQSYVFYDGLGREWETAHLAGAQNIAMCKTYDGKSRLATVTNPAVSGLGIGTGDSSICGANITSYTYDGLNRQLTATAPDGFVTQHLYEPDATTHTNQTLEIEPGATGQEVNRLQLVDAAGRLTRVYENQRSWNGKTYGIAGQSTHGTSYGYDAVDDLLWVSQSSELRTFVYDSLKRMVQATNSESGTVTYGYDDSNNLSTHKDARSITTCFGTWSGSCNTPTTGYDGLNRPQQKRTATG